MILWLSGKLADALQGGGAIQASDRELYVYGLDVLLSTAANILCVLALGLLLGRVPEAAVYLLCFAALRSAAGGYHAGTHLACLLILLAAFGISMTPFLLLPESAYGWLTASLSAASLAAVLILAPAPHENRPASGKELLRFRRLSICIAVAEAGATSSLAFSVAPSLALSASCGMFASASSLAAARISGMIGRRAKAAATPE